jgi:hypothetical protein
MAMLGTEMATVQGWMTEEDWLAGLANANRMVRTPQQALAARLILEDAGKHLGKPKSLGMFVRGGSMMAIYPPVEGFK